VARQKKRVTLADVAREAGVSTMTVSRVINNKGEISDQTRQRINEIIDKLDYRPSRLARGLATSQTYILGLIVPDIANPYFATLASGAEQIAWDNGYILLLCNTQEDPEREREVLRLLEQTYVDGVLVSGSRLEDDDLLPLLENQRAVVLLNREMPSQVAAQIQVNNIGGAHIAVQHLIRTQHQRIGLLTGPSTSQSAHLRAQGYRQALGEAGFDVDPALQVFCTPDEEGGHSAALQMLERAPDLDGLFCYNDLVAIGALQACQEQGKTIPQDIAIIGCDDIPLARFIKPALTTLRADIQQLGRLGLTALIARIQGEKQPSRVMIDFELVIRESAP